MTEKEEQALQQCRDILLLHFDSFVIMTRAQDENGKDSVNTEWHGSLSDIMGVTRIGQLRMDKIALDRSQEPEIK